MLAYFCDCQLTVWYRQSGCGYEGYRLS